MLNIYKIIENITKKINGKWYGRYESKTFGDGVEKSDNRQYQFGESANRINRKLTAKTDKIIVDKYHRESSLDFFIFFDVNQNWKSGENKPFFQNVQKIIDILQSQLYKEVYNSNVFFNNFGKIKPSKFKLKNNELINEIQRFSKETPKKYYSGLQEFLSKVYTEKNKVILIFTDFFAIDPQNTNIVKYLQKNNFVHSFILQKNKNGLNYNSFDLINSSSDYKISNTIIE